jgi:hypothetical protein
MGADLVRGKMTIFVRFGVFWAENQIAWPPLAWFTRSASLPAVFAAAFSSNPLPISA